MRRTPRRERSARQSNTHHPIGRQQIRITHPFHPLQGRLVRGVVTRQPGGEERITFEHPRRGGLCTVPASWTDAMPVDPYLGVGGGRSRFRVTDLLALADLVAVGRGR
ncbi:MAG TPA: DUF5372 family protein [bacterium]|nr:DUF5372 family protein [bacterium]